MTSPLINELAIDKLGACQVAKGELTQHLLFTKEACASLQAEQEPPPPRPDLVPFHPPKLTERPSEILGGNQNLQTGPRSGNGAG